MPISPTAANTCLMMLTSGRWMAGPGSRVGTAAGYGERDLIAIVQYMNELAQKTFPMPATSE